MMLEVSDTLALPDVDAIEAYLRDKGWRIIGSGSIGRLWGEGESSIGVPYRADDHIIDGVIERISLAEGRPKRTVARAIRFRLFDITNLRTANDRLIVDTIPLETAAKVITSARTMFRTVGTTARRERAEISGNYSRLGDEVVRDSLMGHTERGSFIIPVLVPLPEPDQPDTHQPRLDEGSDAPEFHSAQPEPFERRVVRMFAQSLHALKDILVTPAVDPTPTQIHELVYRGVSREFCSALSDILSQTAVAEFEASVEWASAIQAPGRVPLTVTIDADAVDLIDKAASKLRHERVNPTHTFSGTIVQLRHLSTHGDFGEISVSTMRRGRPAEIIVRLPLGIYQQAWEWHVADRAVLIQGKLTSSRGHRTRVEELYRIHPLDEMFLPESV
jgi:hypothetical protein